MQNPLPNGTWAESAHGHCQRARQSDIEREGGEEVERTGAVGAEIRGEVAGVLDHQKPSQQRRPRYFKRESLVVLVSLPRACCMALFCNILDLPRLGLKFRHRVLHR